jgi:hypothetical protein
LWTSRSHKPTVGGKEEKVLIYNEKELNKAWVFLGGAALTGLRVRHDVVALSPGQARRAAWADWNG